MERRAFERINRILPVHFFYNDMPFAGIIENLSEKGLLVCTNSVFYSENTIDLLFPFMQNTEKYTAVVKRIFKTGRNRCNAGVELIDPPKEYLDFVRDIKSPYCTRNHPTL